MIDWTLLLLVVIGVLFVLGLVIALQTAGGRRRLGEAALALAERLIAYAIGWLERNQPAGGVDPVIFAGGVDVPAVAAEGDQRIADARAALMILRGT